MKLYEQCYGIRLQYALFSFFLVTSEKVDVAVHFAQHPNGSSGFFSAAQIEGPAARRSRLVDGLARRPVDAGARGARRLVFVQHEIVERTDDGRCAPSLVVDI